MDKRGYSKNQIKEMGFPTKEYLFPNQEGSFNGKLVMKEWGNKNLICYFETDKSEKYKLCVWSDADDNKSYRPKKTDIDFSMVEINSIWKVTFEISKSGITRWMTAEPINIECS
jgi:hypothetical protein